MPPATTPAPTDTDVRQQQAQRGRSLALAGFSLILVAVILAVGAIHLAAAWSAHEGHGTAGTWTATEDRCGRNCTWVGTFTPTDAQHAARSGVGIDANVSAVGQQFAAVDTGDFNTVYPVGGGDSWIIDTSATAFGAVGMLTWIWFVPVRMIRRRATA